MDDAIEDTLDVAQLLVAALVGEVTCQQHGIHIGGVDFGHGFTQLALVGIAWCHMHITQDSQFDHPTLHGNRHRQQRKQNA